MQIEENVLTFRNLAHTGSQEFYVDIAKNMSILNRRLERQQGLWTVLGMNFIVEDAATGAGIPFEVAVSGAPRNWVTRNALVKAFHAWRAQQQLALDSAGSSSLRPRWEDFKVYLNENHRTTGDLTAISGHPFGGTDPYMIGEWVHSKLVFEEVDGAGLVVQHEPELHILGPDNGNTNVGLIFQYGISRALPFSPDPELPSSIALNIYTQSANALSEQVEEITSNMKSDNNDAPYDPDDYPGGSQNGTEPLLYAYNANSTTLKRKISLNGFSAPNGLLEIQVNAGSQQAPADVYFQLVVGRRIDY